MRTKIATLTFITVIGLFLHFYKISSNPPGLFQDEAAMGYNAFSILRTGKDEYGQVLPIAFRSFTDYKLPLYVYFSVVPVKLFGLTEFSTRFTSGVMGSLSGVVIFLLVLELFGRNRGWLAVISSAVFTFSPWVIMASRSAYESNLSLFLMLIGLLLQLVASRKNNFLILLLSALFYSLSTYAYITTKLLSVIIFPLTAIILGLKRKMWIFAFLFYLLLSLPQFLLLLSASGNNRIASLNPGSDSFFYRQTARYVSYFSPRNLFFEPDADPGKSLPELSVFYPWMVIPYIVGVFHFFRLRTSPGKRIILTLLLLTPIPAAIAKDPFATIRSLPLLFPLIIIIGLGLEKILATVKAPALILLLVLLSAFSLYRSLFVLFPHQRYGEWGYGYKQISTFISQYPDTPVLFEDSRGVYYIQFLFFNKILLHPKPLNSYYNNPVFNPVHSFDRITTRPINWANDPKTDQIIIATPLAINDIQAKDHFLKKIFSVIGPDRKLVFNIYLTQPDIILSR